MRGMSAQRRSDLPDNAEVDVDAAPDRLRTDIDLSDAGLRRIEWPIGKIRVQHQKRVAGFHGVIAGGKAYQTGHADVIRVLPFDMVLAAQGVNDRLFHCFGELHQLSVRARAAAAAAAEQRDALSQVEKSRELFERLVRRRDRGRGRRQSGQLRRRRRNGGFQRHVAGNDHDADAALQNRPAHRDLEHARHLLGTRHELAIAGAFLEEAIGMRLLEIVRADLGRGNLRCDRHHRNARALAVEQAVDKVQVAGAATSTARPPVTWASAPAAKAATSSCRTCSHSIPSRRRMASVKPFKLSPTTP